MNVIICDDDICDQQTIASSVDRWVCLHQMKDAVVTRCFSSAENLLEAWKDGLVVDVAFLDIEIPGELSGLEVAQIIRQTNDQVAIAFVTNYSEYACDGYKVNALRYIKKPISDDSVFECLDIAYRQWNFAQASSMFIDVKKQKTVLPHKQIIYIETQKHYLSIYRTCMKPLEIRSCIADIIGILPDELFLQCHRCFIVNVLYIRNMTRTTLTLAGDYRVLIGQKYVEMVFDKLKQYHQGISI
ncbi:MAG: LytTR family DNA-binding domain-containing protein [Raoultibacter sp.]